jgi:opacity protein-like surface antigen
MRFRSAAIPLVGIAFSLAVGGEALAQQRSLAQAEAGFRNAPVFYFGAGVGGGYINPNESSFDVATRANNAGLCVGCTQSLSTDSTDVGWKVFGGYRFNPYIGIEGSYADLGSFTQKATATGGVLVGTGAPAAGTVVKMKYQVTSWNLMAVGRFPFPDTNFFVQGKLGGAYVMTKNRPSVNGVGVQDEDSERWNLLLGAGFGYDFTNGLTVVLEYENFGTAGDNDTGKANNAGLVSLNGAIRF